MKTKEEVLDSKFKMESTEHDTKVFRYDALDAMEEYGKQIANTLGAQIYELEQSIENLRGQLDNTIEQRDRLQNNLIEKEEVNAELRQTIIAKTQREIILENRLNDGNK